MLTGPYTDLEAWREQVEQDTIFERGAVFWTLLVHDKVVKELENDGASKAQGHENEIQGPEQVHDQSMKTHDTAGQAESQNGPGRALGILALHRIKPAHRTIEVGHVILSSLLQRTTAATEAMYLLGRYVFEDLGYRRFEWKANSLNEASLRSALRLGE